MDEIRLYSIISSKEVSPKNTFPSFKGAIGVTSFETSVFLCYYFQIHYFRFKL